MARAADLESADAEARRHDGRRTDWPGWAACALAFGAFGLGLATSLAMSSAGSLPQAPTTRRLRRHRPGHFPGLSVAATAGDGAAVARHRQVRWWFWFSFLPLVGAIALLVFMCLPGAPDENRFGPPPRGR